MVTRSPRLTPLRLQHVGEAADILVQLAIGDVLRFLRRVVGLPDDGGLLAALLQVAVDAVGGDVERAVLEPFDRDVGIGEGGVLDARIGLDPVEALALLAPELVGLLDALRVELLVFVLVDEGALFPLLRDLHGLDFVVLVLGHLSAPPYATRAIVRRHLVALRYYDRAALLAQSSSSARRRRRR